MYFVYILYSLKDGKLYIGYTSDLERRLNEHESGDVPATRDRRPLKLIHYEAYLSMKDAKQREVFLKGGRGRDELKIQLRATFSEVSYRFRD